MAMYDDVTDDKQVQLLKTILPFTNPQTQVHLALLIHYFQLQNSFQSLAAPAKTICACEIPDGSSRQIEMLKAIKPSFNEEEQNLLDNFINILCIMDSTYLS